MSVNRLAKADTHGHKTQQQTVSLTDFALLRDAKGVNL